MQVDRIEISANELIEKLLQVSETIAVVDARDIDRRGGHIKGSIWAPLSSLTGPRLTELIDQLKSHNLVVFHCLKSQVRGPKVMNLFADVASRRGVKCRCALLTFGFEDFIRVASKHPMADHLLEDVDPKIWPPYLLL